MVGWSGDRHHQKPDSGARPNGRLRAFGANHPNSPMARGLRSKAQAGTTPTPPALARPLTILAPSLSGLLSSARITIGGVEVSSCNYIARTEHLLGVMLRPRRAGSQFRLRGLQE